MYIYININYNQPTKRVLRAPGRLIYNSKETRNMFKDLRVVQLYSVW